MNHENHLFLVPEDPQGTLLHNALQQTLPAPRLPADFRARVMAAVLEDRLQEIEARRKEMELEHAQAMQQLRSGHVVLQRDTLAMIAAGAFAAGSCASLAVPSLSQALSVDSAILMPAVALAIGVFAGLGVWFERFGRPDVLSGVDLH